MKFMSIITFAGALALSSLVLAEGGGDKAFEKMMAANAKAMEQYAISQGKAPCAKEYEYGMKVDVVKGDQCGAACKSLRSGASRNDL
jgi:hypothetical protein